MKALLAVAFVITILFPMKLATAETIIVWDRVKERHPMMFTVLKQSLEQTRDEYGDYNLVLSSQMEQGRVTKALSKNKLLQVAVFAPDPDRENYLLPIRIPNTKGLLGYRVCLIREGNQQKFDHIKSLEDWQASRLSIGQGTHWPDTQVLEANGIKVVKNPSYNSLFEMLMRDRFDCFARSVNEVLLELDSHKHRGISLEQNLLLVYRLPMFFFVSKENPLLAERLEKGMLMLIESGEFDAIFQREYVIPLTKINVINRKKIHLDNPFLTDQTKSTLDNESFWYNPNIN